LAFGCCLGNSRKCTCGDIESPLVRALGNTVADAMPLARAHKLVNKNKKHWKEFAYVLDCKLPHQ